MHPAPQTARSGRLLSPATPRGFSRKPAKSTAKYSLSSVFRDLLVLHTIADQRSAYGSYQLLADTQFRLKYRTGERHLATSLKLVSLTSYDMYTYITANRVSV